MSGFSDDRKNKILTAMFGGAHYEESENNFLTLVTVPVKGSDTGASIIEPTYTGFVRIPMKNSDWSAAAAGKRHNTGTKVFHKNEGATTSTLRGWAYVTTEELASGLVICSGSLPETVVVENVEPEYLAGQLVFSIFDT